MKTTAESQMTLCVTEPIFIRKTSFVSNTGRMGQNWAKNFFLNLLKKLVFNFY